MEISGQRRLPLDKLLWGVVLITVGTLFTLNNTEYIDISGVWQFWPLILIGMGIVRMVQPQASRRRGSGLWMILIGSWLLIGTLGLFGLDYGSSWPLLIVAVGAGMIWEALSRQRRAERHIGGENGAN